TGPLLLLNGDVAGPCEAPAAAPKDLMRSPTTSDRGDIAFRFAMRDHYGHQSAAPRPGFAGLVTTGLAPVLRSLFGSLEQYPYELLLTRFQHETASRFRLGLDRLQCQT